MRIGHTGADRGMVSPRIRLCPGHTAADTHTSHSNNNEVYAHELTTVFDDFMPVRKPWSRGHFGKNISDGIGVYTTHNTKVESLHSLLGLLWKNSICISEHVFTVGLDAYNPREESVDPEDALETLCEQLSWFTDNENGSVSGKARGDDDAGMALLLAVLWSVRCIGLDKNRPDPW